MFQVIPKFLPGRNGMHLSLGLFTPASTGNFSNSPHYNIWNNYLTNNSVEIMYIQYRELTMVSPIE